MKKAPARKPKRRRPVVDVRPVDDAFHAAYHLTAAMLQVGQARTRLRSVGGRSARRARQELEAARRALLAVRARLWHDGRVRTTKGGGDGH